MRLQLASGIAAVRSYEAERLRLDELAALDRAKVSWFVSMRVVLIFFPESSVFQRQS